VTKKRAKTGFIIFSIVLAIGLFLTFCPFNISFSYQTFNGFFNALTVGTDLAGGSYSVYECKLNEFNGASNFEIELDNTISSLQGTLHAMGYNSAIVTKENGNKIRVETANHKDLTDVRDIIGSYSTLYITSLGEDDFDLANPTGNYLTSKNIVSVTNSFAGQASTFNIMLNFDAEGAELYHQITKEASESEDKKIYVYAVNYEGEQVDIFGSQSIISLDCKEESKDNFLGFGSSSFTNQNSADVVTLPFITSTYGVTMQLVETEDITPTLGSNALTYIIIALFIAFVATILVLIYRYRDLGLIAGLGAIFFMVMNLFLLQTISYVMISVGSLIALVLTYILMFDGYVIIFEKVREEYKLGKKIPLSVKGGFKKAVWPIVDVNIVTTLIAVVLCCFSAPLFRSIGFILLVGSLLGIFTTLVVSKLLCGWYLYLNSTKAKRLNLERDKTLVIKDEIVVNPSEEGGEQ
jgi:preprotein translocase subunit SecD